MKYKYLLSMLIMSHYYHFSNGMMSRAARTFNIIFNKSLKENGAYLPLLSFFPLMAYSRSIDSRDKALKVLELSSNATEIEIKTQYYFLAKQYHPDINNTPGADEQFRKINEAYNYLMNKYDTANVVVTSYNSYYEKMKNMYEEIRYSEDDQEFYNFQATAEYKKLYDDFIKDDQRIADSDEALLNFLQNQDVINLSLYEKHRLFRLFAEKYKLFGSDSKTHESLRKLVYLLMQLSYYETEPYDNLTQHRINSQLKNLPQNILLSPLVKNAFEQNGKKKVYQLYQDSLKEKAALV